MTKNEFAKIALLCFASGRKHCQIIIFLNPHLFDICTHGITLALIMYASLALERECNAIVFDETINKAFKLLSSTSQL